VWEHLSHRRRCLNDQSPSKMKRRGSDIPGAYSRRPPFDRGPPRDDLGPPHHGPPFGREQYRWINRGSPSLRPCPDVLLSPTHISCAPLFRHDAFPPAYGGPPPQDPYGGPPPQDPYGYDGPPMGGTRYADHPPGPPRGDGFGGRPPPPNPTAVVDLPEEPELIFEVPIPKVSEAEASMQGPMPCATHYTPPLESVS